MFELHVCSFLFADYSFSAGAPNEFVRFENCALRRSRLLRISHLYVACTICLVAVLDCICQDLFATVSLSHGGFTTTVASLKRASVCLAGRTQ